MEDIGLLIIRIVAGLFYAAHGSQKAFGWFGGAGPKGTGEFFESVGIRPGSAMALLAGLGEFIGGLLFTFGLFIPLAALLIIIPMIVAIITVHGKNGWFVDRGGIEYNLVLIAIAIGITFTGPGVWSLDEAYGIQIFG
ncbi:DoxX family protein [Peribacillus kribbensis]|uniref:DoxX family protein n=1 Tax=Peribacillus kribbensis TaxID=356658 RepID=UPI00041AE9FE|nr:DoxX family protein [Peribacillus kribbensis]